LVLQTNRYNKYRAEEALKDRAYWIGLSLVPGIGESRLKLIISRFKSARAVFEASRSDLRDSGLFDKNTIASLSKSEFLELGQRQLEQLKNLDGNIVTFMDEDYPANLGPLDESPPLLYVLGTLKEGDSLAIAIVGSRRATAYGRATAERLSFDLAKRGVTIVSGLATGVDAAAHRGALRAGGRTVAVLGCGLDVNYPASNWHLREKIITSGALVTEFSMGTQPLAGNFPKRNRIVSGLSLGIVVVEAAPKSGTFSTVKWAADQGREVFAVPGDVNRKTSSGTNRLISEGAKLTTCADDVLEEIGILEESQARAPEVALSDVERTVVETLDYGPIHVDEVAKHSKMALSETLSVLLSLELKGVVKQSPGKIFSLESRRG